MYYALAYLFVGLWVYLLTLPPFHELTSVKWEFWTAVTMMLTWPFWLIYLLWEVFRG